MLAVAVLRERLQGRRQVLTDAQRSGLTAGRPTGAGRTAGR
jgi:hypothetical protein